MTTEPDTSDGSFDEVWTRAEAIPGWLTEVQARRLWAAAAAVGPDATIVEIGSHQGRSTVVLASALGSSGGRVVAIDPFVDGPMFGGRSTRALLEANLSRFEVSETVRLIAEKSQRVRRRWERPLDLLYIDGKHDYWTCSDDLRWAGWLRPGGIVLVHDAFSSVGVTIAVLVHVLGSSDLAYVGRDGSLARFERRRPVPAERAAIVRQLPWWTRNLAVKAALRLRVPPLARLLGHQGDADPY